VFEASPQCQVNLLLQISTLVWIEFIRANKPVECGAIVRTRLLV